MWARRGLIALIRDKQISPMTLLGKIYVVTTIVTCGSSCRARLKAGGPMGT